MIPMDISTLHIAVSILSALIQGLTTLFGLFISLQFLLLQISPYYTESIHKRNLNKTFLLLLITLVILVVVSLLPMWVENSLVYVLMAILSFFPFLGTLVFFRELNKSLNVKKTYEEIKPNCQNIGILVDIALYHLKKDDLLMFKHYHGDIVYILLNECAKGNLKNINENIISHLVRLSSQLISTGHLAEVEELIFALYSASRKAENNQILFETVRYQVEITKMILTTLMMVNGETLIDAYLERINIMLFSSQNELQQIQIPLSLMEDLIDMYLLVIIMVKRTIYENHLIKLFKSITLEPLYGIESEKIERVKLKLEYFKGVLNNILGQNQKNRQKVIQNLNSLLNSLEILNKGY